MRDEPLAEGFPKPRGDSRPWNCAKGAVDCTRKVPCMSCRNKRNRRKGKRGQHSNRRVLEDVCDVKVSWAGKLANEETADHLPVRYENKAGKAGGANSVARFYLAAEAQSEAARAIGDNRPFCATFSPDGMSDGLVVVRTSMLAAFVEACVLSANRPD